MTSNHYKVDDEIYGTNQLTHEDIPSLIKYLNNQIIHDNALTIPIQQKMAKILLKNKNLFQIATIGYWLGEPYWHRGLMPKVFELKHTFSWNKASMRVVEKCDFEFEGILRKLVYKDGQDIDVHSYALII
ncbi:unnamed protein product [Rotaria magnacalcarata]|uniref:Uncharacterized protein n=1 Tax=Rotaria magnacalcarata TaxID=392030 RepID=A0A818W8T2_9BILA|nr:unnamed protein product [Rotaria magnacalcarata]